MADLDGLKKVLRSLVVSSAATMDAAALLRDFRRMMGEPLPAARYGYRDPVLFLRERCSDCFLFHGPQGNPILTLIVPDSIKHIDQYVQSQKSSKLVRGKRRSVPESILRKPQTNLIASTFNRVPPKVEEWNINSIPKKPTRIEQPLPEPPRASQTYIESRKPNPPPLVSKPVAITAKPVASQPNSHVEVKPAEAPVKNELANGHEKEYSRQRLQRFFEKRMPVYQSQRLSVSKESLKDDDSGRLTSSSLSSRSAAALGTLQAEVARLVARRPAGVGCSELLRLYEEEYGCELNFARFRYPSVSACACAVPGLSARRTPTGDWLLTLQGEQEPPPPPPGALRVRRAPPGGRPASRALLDPDDALPGIDYDPDVFPEDCLSFLESIPQGSVAGVEPGDMLGLVVGEVYSPSHLWVLRLGPDLELMERFMDEMTEYYNKGEGADRVLAAGARRPGQYCSSVFEGDWHRSLIVRLVDSDTVKVRHVDYGTVDTVPACSLRPLRREWASLPAQAVRARLAGLRPAAACRRWPRPAAAHLLRLVHERRLVGNVVSVDREENILELFLIDTSTDDDVNISDEMVRAGHADPRPLPALGAREPYLLPSFAALESGATPNYAEIYALLRDGIDLEYVDSYRNHVASLLPSSSEDSGSTEPERQDEASDAGASPPPPPPPLAANRVPMALSLLRLVSSSPEPARSPSPEPRQPSPTPSPPLSPVPETRQPSPTPSPPLSPVPETRQPSPAPSPIPATPDPAAAPPAANTPSPAPAPAACCSGQPSAPHPASFYALPFFPCSPAPCYPKPPVSLPLRYAPGYFRPRVSARPAPPHFYPQYPRPPVSVSYYPNLQPVYSNASQNLHSFSPAQPLSFVSDSMQNPQVFVPYSAAKPQHFVPNSAQNPQHFAQMQNFGPGSTQVSQRSQPQVPGPIPAPNAQKIGQRPAPSLQNIGSDSTPSPLPNGAAQHPPNGPDSAVRLSAEDCEYFELLSRVDPGAAHRFMIAALRRARGAGPGAGAGSGAPDRAGSAPPVSSGLNPEAAEFGSPTKPAVRPPPGFENFTK